MFLRGLNLWRADEFRYLDGERKVGSKQKNSFAAHAHKTGVVDDNNVDGIDSTTTRSKEHHNQKKNTSMTGGSETRPNKVAVYYKIN